MYRLSLATRILLSGMLAFGLTAFQAPAHTADAAVSTVYLPNITKTLGGASGWTTPIVVQNTGTIPSDVTITLYRFSDGAQAAQVKTPQLKPGQSWSFDPRTNAQLPNDTQFSAVVQATTGQVAATVIEGSGSSWMAYAGTTTGASTVYLPNITRNLGGAAGWNTPFIVQNIGTKATTAAVSFYSFGDGSLAKTIENVKLEPGRSQAFLTWAINGLRDDAQYAVVVRGPADAQLYAIVNEVSGSMAMSYEGLLGGSDVVYLPNVLKYLGGSDHWFTPFIVQNLGATATSVSVEFYSFDTGARVATLSGLILQPGRSAPVDVRFNPVTLPAGSYSVVLRGAKDSLLGAVVNEVDPGAGMAMSYLGVGKTQALPSAYLPFLQKNVATAGWFSPIVAQNVGAAATDITLTIFDGNGEVAMQKVFAAVKPGAAAVYDPRSDRRLKNGTYSGLVQAAENVSAVVNIAGAVSGDYAMAFTSTSAPQTAVPAFAAQSRLIGSYQFTLHMRDDIDLWVESSPMISPAVADRLADLAERDAKAIQTEFARPFAKIPVVYAFASAASYETGLQVITGFSATQAKQVAANSNAMFHPTSKVILANWSSIASYVPQSAIRHELSHAMVDQIAGTNPNVPAWLNEGHAYLEEPPMPYGRWLDMLSRYGTASMAATGTLYPLVQMESSFVWASRTGYAATYQYYESAQVVLMLRGDVGEAGIVRILELMGEGKTVADAYALVSGKPYSDFVSAIPDRAKALATTYPGLTTVSDSPVGQGLSFIAYGFIPNRSVTLEIRLGDHATVRTETSNQFGSIYHYLGSGWTSGTYQITALQGAASVAVTVPVTFGQTAAAQSLSMDATEAPTSSPFDTAFTRLEPDR